MARTNTKKMERKLERQGKMSANQLRGSWNGINPVTKKSPTLLEKIQRKENKHKKRNASTRYSEDDSASFFNQILQ